MNNGRGSACIKKMENLITENNLDNASYKLVQKTKIYMNCYLIID